MKKLKAKSRVGSIFFDKVHRVIAAVQRDQGKYDYLVEWQFNERDKLKPEKSVVKGSHFVFYKPLLFRRCVEAQFVEKCLNQAHPAPLICPSQDVHPRAVAFDAKVITSADEI